ncbi:MAG: glycosyltransferase family 39 protein, partial [Acidobacteriota bacterium]
MNRLRPLLIFVAALAVRLVYVAQIRDLIYFDVPLVDGANYFRSASAIAGGDLLGGRGAFWQPPLYPYFLALLIALFGRRMTAIYTVQAAVGSLSCLLVYFVGRRVFGERAGLLAAAVTVLYGPLVYFDAQPLIPVLHIALTLAGLLLLLRAGGVPGPAASPRRDWCLGGLAWGLSAIATPNILLAVPAAALWARRRARPARRPLALFLIGVCAPIALVTARNAVVARELILISSNGGINFYIGNNPDYRRTTQIRPGGEFERLAQEPENLGILGAGGRSRYFARRAVTFLVSRPGQALRLYGRKALDLIAGREIPRNQEIYAYRRHSPLLAALLWRAGVSFPFGVVAPLALAGALIRPRRGADPARRAPGRPLLLLYAAAYAFSI